MEAFIRFVRRVRARARTILTTNWNFALEFQIIEFLLGTFAFNPFDGSEVLSKSTKYRVWAFYGFYLFWLGLTLKNALIDFSGDSNKQFSALIVTFGAVQMIFKMLSLLMSRKKLFKLKHQILEEAKNPLREVLDVEMKMRKIIRTILLTYVTYFAMVFCLLLPFAFYTNEPFAMPAYIQLPWTNLHSHPSYEINYAALFLFVLVAESFFCGYDGFFLMITLHCISELEVCCHYALELADSETEESQKKAIDEFIKMHLKVLELIRTIDSIFGLSNFGQLLSTLGFFVMIAVQATHGIDFCSMLMFLSAMAQLFMYCYLSEYIVTMCEKLRFSLYSSKWYDIRSISLRKRIVLMLLIMQETKGFSTAGLIDINLATYSDIISRSYSFITCLKNVT